MLYCVGYFFDPKIDNRMPLQELENGVMFIMLQTRVTRGYTPGNVFLGMSPFKRSGMLPPIDCMYVQVNQLHMSTTPTYVLVHNVISCWSANM